MNVIFMTVRYCRIYDVAIRILELKIKFSRKCMFIFTYHTPHKLLDFQITNGLGCDECAVDVALQVETLGAFKRNTANP